MQSFDLVLEIYLYVKTRRGLLRKTIYIGPSRSFLKQWPQCIKGIVHATDETNVKDIAGTLQTFSYTIFGWKGLAAETTRGIVLGTGTTAVAIDDYKLQTQIAHGSGAGQLDHKLQTVDAFQVVGGVASFRMRRQFENLSGGTITIKEAGIYARDALNHNICVVRDVLASTQDVLNGHIIEARYTFNATV